MMSGVSAAQWVRPVVQAFAIFMLFYGLFVLLSQQPKADAQAAPQAECRSAIVLDRSGSVGDNLTAMTSQVKLLFDPTTGFYNDKYKIAFWSFSSTVNRTSNYDAPYYPYVSSRGHDSKFEQALDSVVSAGGTDYEQGFGFDGYVFNNQKINTYGTPPMDQIIKNADVIVFMTDGVPNTPGQGENNQKAIDAAQAAVDKLRNGQAGKKKFLAGGIVEGTYQGTLNLLINGSTTNGKDVFTINQNYGNLASQLKKSIGDMCKNVIPPNPAANYQLIPTVTTTNQVVSGTDSASFQYNVTNTNKAYSSDTTGWSVKRLIVDRGQDVAPLTSGSGAYLGDSYDCGKLKALVKGKARCDEVANGQRVFAQGTTSLNGDVGAAGSVQIDDSIPIGSKICFVLTIAKPTQEDSPVDRYSYGACTTIGKRPMVQIHGGDLRVGRHFSKDKLEKSADGTPLPAAEVRGVSTTKLQPDNSTLTFGSWAEYGVFAPGLVVGFASLSGFEGGRPTNIQEEWSKLTFANTDNEYGLYTPDDSGQGTIPDVVSALLTGKTATTVNDSNVNVANLQSGLYRKESGGLNLVGGTIGKGKSVIVNAPDGTVTITGDIHYDDVQYYSINEIPQLVIIAKNIIVNSSVTNVDAWLLTTGTGNDGRVATCEIAQLTTEVCKDRLTVNGPIMARHLDLFRTAGAGQKGASGDPAEVINLPADAYLWSQSAGHSEVRAQTTMTTELPPYF